MTHFGLSRGQQGNAHDAPIRNIIVKATKSERQGDMSSDMERNLTPCELEFLLHCYYSPNPFERIWAPALQDAAERMTMLEVILPCPKMMNVWIVTEKGKFWIEDILSTPPPVQQWASGRTEEKSS